MNLMGIFTKSHKIGYFITVEWSKKAEELCLAYDGLKRIVHYNDGYVVDEESYSRVRLMEYMKKGVPIFNMTAGQSIPKDSLMKSRVSMGFGKLELSRPV